MARLTHFSLRDGPNLLASSLTPGLYPPARLARLGPRAGLREWPANLVYLGLVLAGLPWTLAESAAGAGAAVMVEARPSREPR